MGENKRMHMEMIQNVISRMASNSFMLKGWAVTLIAGIFALASKDAEKTYFLIAYVPIIIFWVLDSYYLRFERQYRNLYDKVRRMNDDDIDFSMNSALPELQSEKTTLFRCFISASELCFYVPLAVLSAVIIII